MGPAREKVSEWVAQAPHPYPVGTFLEDDCGGILRIVAVSVPSYRPESYWYKVVEYPFGERAGGCIHFRHNPIPIYRYHLTRWLNAS